MWSIGMRFCATKGFQDSPRVQLWSKCIKWFPSCEVKLCPYPLLWPLAYTTACTMVHTMESIRNNTETPLGYGSHQTLDGNVSGKHCKLLRWVYRHSFRVLSRASRKSYGGMCDRSLWELKAGDQCESPTFSRWINFSPEAQWCLVAASTVSCSACIASMCVLAFTRPKAGLKVGAPNWTKEHESVWDGPTSKAMGHDPSPHAIGLCRCRPTCRHAC